MSRKTRLLNDEQIIKLYNEGMEYKELSVLAGISDRGIRDVLYKHGIPKRPRYRKHKVNEDFFKTWSNEMAWVLGLLITDGCITSNNSFSFSQNDEKILNLVAKHMEADVVLAKITETKDVPTLLVNSQKMVKDLAKLGMHPNKSLNMEFPNIPEEYMSHFIRGVVDGNGWVQKKAYTVVVTSGSKDFAEGLNNVISSWGINTYIRDTEVSVNNNITYRINVSGKDDVANFAEIIYKDCDDNFMDRKREAMSMRLIKFT